MEETTTLDHSADVYEPSLTPDALGKLGMWLFLISDAMSFGALLAAYGAVRAGAAEWAPPAEILGINLTAGMTFLLICSSVTMVKALGSDSERQPAEDVYLPRLDHSGWTNLLGPASV